MISALTIFAVILVLMVAFGVSLIAVGSGLLVILSACEEWREFRRRR